MKWIPAIIVIAAVVFWGITIVAQLLCSDDENHPDIGTP
jgi:hypothetical protein